MGAWMWSCGNGDSEAICIQQKADVCGDEILDSVEGCDDGNNDNGDGCSATCRIESGSACGTDTAGLTGDDSCMSNVCNTDNDTCEDPVNGEAG